MPRIIPLRWDRHRDGSPVRCADCGAALITGSPVRYYGPGKIYGTECHSREGKATCEKPRKESSSGAAVETPAVPATSCAENLPPASSSTSPRAPRRASTARPGKTSKTRSSVTTARARVDLDASPTAGDLSATVDAKALAEALGNAKRFAALRSAIPALGHVRLWTSEDVLYIDVTDLETWHRQAVPAEIQRPGTSLAPLASLHKLTQSIRGPVALRSAAPNLSVSWSGGSNELRTLPADDWPVWPEIPPTDVVKIDGAALRGALSRVACAASREESRFQLSAVLFERAAESLTLTATDGHRLHTLRLPVSEAAEAPSVLFPISALSALLRGKADAWAGTVRHWQTEAHVALEMPGGLTVSRIMEGTFPDYERVLKSDDPAFTAKVDGSALREALRQVASAISESSPCVRVEANGSIRLLAENPDLGKARAESPVLFSRGELTIGLNPHYLADLCELGEFELRGVDENHALLVNSGGFRAALMPIRLT